MATVTPHQNDQIVAFRKLPLSVRLEEASKVASDYASFLNCAGRDPTHPAQISTTLHMWATVEREEEERQALQQEKQDQLLDSLINVVSPLHYVTPSIAAERVMDWVRAHADVIAGLYPS